MQCDVGLYSESGEFCSSCPAGTEPNANACECTGINTGVYVDEYGEGYGTSCDEPWDLAQSYCEEVNGTVPSWCYDSWCYVSEGNSYNILEPHDHIN